MTLETTLQAELGTAFTVERELGGGGMSRVFVALDRALGRRIVVKVLPPELAADVSVERFRREIQLAAQLQHPLIVPLLTAAEGERLLYYTMPMVEGESLRARLSREGELPLAEAARLLRDVAEALAYAHARGVVHRDIKPENILLSGGHALVLDFGVAVALSSATTAHRLTGTGVGIGTPEYMAPEQAMGEGTLDHRADLYALGILAYEMLTGRPPFHGRPLPAVITAHLTEAPEEVSRRREALAEPMARLVMSLLEKRPADRPQSAQAVVAALDGAEATGRVTAGAGAPARGSAPGPAARPGRRVAIATAGVVAAVALAALAVTALPWRPGAEASGSAAASSLRRVVVAPFQNLTGDPALDHVGMIAADWLMQGLVNTEGVGVVSPTAVAAALRERDGSSGDLVRDLATATGARYVITGSVVRTADSLQLAARLVESASGEVLSTVEPARTPVGDPIPAIDAIATRLRSSLVADEAMQGTVRSKPPLYAAYQEFIAGRALFVRAGEFARAREHFERAIAIDSTFGLPYNLLALSYQGAGDWDAAERVILRLDAIRSELSPIGVLQLDGLLASLRGDHAEQLRVMQRAAARDSSAAHLLIVGSHANALLRPAISVPALERGAPGMIAVGSAYAASQRARAHHLAGDHATELARLLEARRELGGVPLPAEELAALAGLGRGTTALARADSMLRDSPATDAQAVTAIVDAALEFRAHGDPATARRLLDAVVRWCDANAAGDAGAARALAEGRARLLVGDATRAEDAFRTARGGRLALDAAGYLGLARLATGDRAFAARTADSLAALDRRWLFGRHLFWGGALQAALGDRARALELLRRAHRAGVGLEDWHWHAALDPMRGYPPFDAMLRPVR